MSLHFLAATVGALLAAGGCGVLAARSLRTPNSAVIAWAVALAGLTVSLGAQALGYKIGFWATAFRAMAVGGLVVAPFALVLGLTELAAKGLATRFAARLILSALAFVTVIILSTDPLSSATFTKVWPNPATYYQPIPNYLLKDLLPPVTVLVALIAVVTAAVRQGRDPAWREALLPAGAAGVAAVALSVPGIAALAKVNLPVATAFVLLSILAVAATWFAGIEASKLDLGVLRGTAGAGPRRNDGARDFGSAPGDEFGIYRNNSSRRGDGGLDYPPAAGDRGHPGYRDDPEFSEHRGLRDPDRYPAGDTYRDEPGFSEHGEFRDPDGYPGGGGYPHDTGYTGEPGFGDHAGLGAPEEYPGGGGYAGHTGYPEEGGFPGEPGYRGQPGYTDPEAGYPDQPGYQDQAGFPGEPNYRGQPGYTDPKTGYPDQPGYREQPGYRGAGPGPANGDPQMFGQIAIYTLLEDRVDDFDRLTRKVVRQVREQEPDTVVYIVHAVPAAPMQRILYEVYRDRTAYEDHKRQPYVIDFEADRRPYVLATNVIELGLQQAKVSPLPSVTDLLTDTGFDLLSDTGFGQPGYGPRHTPRHGGDIADGGSAARSL